MKSACVPFILLTLIFHSASAQIQRIKPTPRVKSSTSSTSTQAPVTSTAASPSTGSASFSVNFEKIVLAYRNNFYSIQGDLVPSEKEKSVYKSTLSLPGTLHAMIYRFQSRQDTSASWQAIMYRGDDQVKAGKVYKSVCRQVNKMRIGGIGTFKGDYEEPDQNLRFAGSIFKMETKDSQYDNFFAEVDLLLNSDEEWEVHLNLVRKKEDQDMY